MLTPLVSFSQTSDLFFSEYVEGGGNNKYLEIYNGTGATVDLSDYIIERFNNGGSGTPSGTMELTGSLADGDVYTIGNSGGTIFTADIDHTITYYNGDDAVALKKVSTGNYVDIIGCIGEDPGSAWSDGSHSTANKTLVRKASVSGGVTTNPTSGFPTLVTEWNVYNQDEPSYLGSHTYSSVTGSLELTSPNGGESYSAGQTVKLTWNSTNVTNVYFEVWTQDSEWNPISGNIASPDGSNEYDFTIPANAFTGDQYKVKVVDADNVSVMDESDAAFSIDGHDTELLWENFEGSQFNSTFQVSVTGTKIWTANDGYGEMNGYDNAAQENEEDWLISNAINLDNTSDELLAFQTSLSYPADGSDLTVFYSSDYSGSGDPSGSTWNPLTAAMASSSTYTHSGYIDLSSVSGTIYIGFKYIGTTTDADRWRINEIEVTGVNSTPTDLEDTKESDVVISPNPFYNELLIKSSKDVQKAVIVNTAGQIVKNDLTGSKRITTANLSKGLYILQVEFTDGTSTTQKVIKK
ncbi:lamin tail domain-containing protein [Carboxylicivirga sp. RSCT41]|uniref:lamin tail domain-containing protein n=1 Tax=Carboxylicivirga agarovorans TaxID=3417570 RepID=UPI003D32D681